jgi:hypothetical protein
VREHMAGRKTSRLGNFAEPLAVTRAWTPAVTTLSSPSPTGVAAPFFVALALTAPVVRAQAFIAQTVPRPGRTPVNIVLPVTDMR